MTIVDDDASARILVWRDPRGRKCWERNVPGVERRVPDEAHPYVAAEVAEQEVDSRQLRIEELEGIMRTMLLELKACYDTLEVEKEDREVLDAAKEALDGKLRKRLRRETARERRVRLRGW